jgi:hypothetical protein
MLNLLGQRQLGDSTAIWKRHAGVEPAEYLINGS